MLNKYSSIDNETYTNNDFDLTLINQTKFDNQEI